MKQNVLNIKLFKSVTSHYKNNSSTPCHTLSQKLKDPSPLLCEILFEWPTRVEIFVKIPIQKVNEVAFVTGNCQEVVKQFDGHQNSDIFSQTYRFLATAF